MEQGVHPSFVLGYVPTENPNQWIWPLLSVVEAAKQPSLSSQLVMELLAGMHEKLDKTNKELSEVRKEIAKLKKSSPMPELELLSINDCARIARCGRDYLVSEFKRRKFPMIHRGHARYIQPKHLKAYLDSQDRVLGTRRHKPAPPPEYVPKNPAIAALFRDDWQ